MVQLIVGKKGKGKTKQLLDKVNNEVKNIAGNIVYLDNSFCYFLLVHKNTSFEFSIKEFVFIAKIKRKRGLIQFISCLGVAQS